MQIWGVVRGMKKNNRGKTACVCNEKTFCMGRENMMEEVFLKKEMEEFFEKKFFSWFLFAENFHCHVANS